MDLYRFLYVYVDLHSFWMIGIIIFLVLESCLTSRRLHNWPRRRFQLISSWQGLRPRLAGTHGFSNLLGTQKIIHIIKILQIIWIIKIIKDTPFDNPLGVLTVHGKAIFAGPYFWQGSSCEMRYSRGPAASGLVSQWLKVGGLPPNFW